MNDTTGLLEIVEEARKIPHDIRCSECEENGVFMAHCRGCDVFVPMGLKCREKYLRRSRRGGQIQCKNCGLTGLPSNTIIWLPI